MSPGGQADGRTDGGGDGNKFTESEGYRSEKQNAKLPSSLSRSSVWLIDFRLTVMELRKSERRIDLKLNSLALDLWNCLLTNFGLSQNIFE